MTCPNCNGMALDGSCGLCYGDLEVPDEVAEAYAKDGYKSPVVNDFHDDRRRACEGAK